MSDRLLVEVIMTATAEVTPAVIDASPTPDKE